MKKFLLTLAMGMAAFGLMTATAQAGQGKHHKHHHKHHHVKHHHKKA